MSLVPLLLTLPRMDEQVKKSFDFASDLTKQLLTLSTGIIALTITFLKDVVGDAPTSLKWCIALAWVFYFFSIAFGLWTMMALTGSLAPLKPAEKPPEIRPSASIRGANVTVPSAAQVITFGIGLVLTITFGILAFGTIK